ncbi:hypothetical protein SAMN05421676_10587 [Salinibacillus kushneri]|uniref:Uncharacterized protein n=1 Tax=Salinibacillus kushneri TaxID=237682 RepID=A0A1I0EUR9_9BACI|nr:hypothetical protein [Salinibacillus kushneri]SET49199.1 hypothetical protein SAMN05421676_10587 [Salinibacillus kushneri]
MKNFKFLFALAIILFTSMSLLPNNASASSWSEWQTVTGDCQVRVWTDYSVYTSNATSVDVQAESRNCPQLDYYMDVWGTDSTGYEFMIRSIDQVTGYFSYLTPVKKLYLDDLNHSTQARVRVLLTGSVPNTAVWSDEIMIYR